MPDSSKVKVKVEVENLEELKELREELEKVKELKKEIKKINDTNINDSNTNTDPLDIEPEPWPGPERDWPRRPKFWCTSEGHQISFEPYEGEENDIMAEATVEL